MGLTKTLSKQIPLLTIFTILTYAMAYCYQKGVAAYYGYPDLFIKIDLNTLLYSAAWLLFFSILFLFGLYISLTYDLKGKYYVSFLVFILVVLIPYYFIIGFHWPFGHFAKNSIMSSMDALIFAMLFINYFNTVSPSINNKRHKQHMESIMDHGKLAEQRHVFYYIDFKTLRSAIPLGAFTLLMLSYTSGKITSFKNNEYYMIDNNPSKVLLNSFSSGFVIGKCEDFNASFEFRNELNNMEIKRLAYQNNVKKLKGCFEMRVKD
ncbi:TPA: hypothetical protein RJ955_002877 [Enterobacter hormaechei]|uniref:hypothetical protein n=1 Tax=Enterobacter hormaechei TaxID=158836 RepID=UPI0012567143|nr:hypothetical protein [Enterobacter hormaechei]EKY3920326.1 hypothetical protein [Enterobacter hormaechei]VAC62108.1 Uncharacterised protein [Enterobacter hormaechei]HDV8214066.1 hypothetical protein [Enterobacter hormaechei]